MYNPSCLFYHVSSKNSYFQNNLVFSLVVQASMLLYNWQTKFMNLSKMICLLLDLSKAFNTDNSSTILKNYKYLKYMEKILSDLKSI